MLSMLRRRCSVAAARLLAPSCGLVFGHMRHSSGGSGGGGRLVDISVDRSGLSQPADAPLPPLAGSPMERHLLSLIRFRGGPLTVAEFQAASLTHPLHGYYMRRDVFGAAGDFTTSPEISQLFGEMVCVWAVATWASAGSPPRFVLLEMGPGRGTLMRDLLRVAPRGFVDAAEVHLVEVSPFARSAQARALGVTPDGASSAGPRVAWHSTLATVPQEPHVPTVGILHEFLDALPVHQFERTDRGWVERLVDAAPAAAAQGESVLLGPDGRPLLPSSAEPRPQALRFVLSPRPTPASSQLVPRALRRLPEPLARGLTRLEVCPAAETVWHALAARISATTGAAGGVLAIDYGGEGPLPYSLAAIRRHGFVDLLASPGEADLSAHVDFGALRHAVSGGGGGSGGGGRGEGGNAVSSAVACHGPVTQRAFLRDVGIAARVEALAAAITAGGGDSGSAGGSWQAGAPLHAENASADARVDELLSGAHRLVDDGPGGMGARYKAFAVCAAAARPPAGFGE